MFWDVLCCCVCNSYSRHVEVQQHPLWLKMGTALSSTLTWKADYNVKWINFESWDKKHKELQLCLWYGQTWVHDQSIKL